MTFTPMSPTKMVLFTYSSLRPCQPWRTWLGSDDLEDYADTHFDRMFLQPDTDQINFESLGVREEQFNVVKQFNIHRSNVEFPIIVEKDDVIQYATDNILRELFKTNTSYFEGVMSHGCFCARFNSNVDQSILGGYQMGIDAFERMSDEGLDQLCKQWLSARFCNKNPGGTCHNYAAIDDPYHIDIEGFDDWTCKDTENCPLDNCIIDIEYGRRIYDLIVDNSHRLSNIFKTADLGDCTPNGPAIATGPRQCTGTVPDIYMVSQESSPEPVTPWSEA